MGATEWVKRWKCEIATEATRPGIWRMKSGGFLVRARVLRDGKRREAMRTLPKADLREAVRVQSELAATLTMSGAPASRPLFATYAVELLKRKVAKGKLRRKTAEMWTDVLEQHVIPGIGHFYFDELNASVIDAWLTGAPESGGPSIASRVRDVSLPPRTVVVKGNERSGTWRLSPHTVNGWLRIVRTICNAATKELRLEHDPFDGVEFFETSAHNTYTRESPNALNEAQFAAFTKAMRAPAWAQWFPMVLLGFVTGLRPSTLRPLRRRGPNADIDWDTGLLDVRRSNAVGDDVVDAPKEGTPHTIVLPPSVLAVLREHVDGLVGKAAKSDLLFPSRRTGRMVATTALIKPFNACAKAAGIPFHVTPKAMRRTFQDLTRAVGVDAVITRSISGHKTEAMRQRYSTAAGSEQSTAIDNVAALAILEPLLGGKMGGSKLRKRKSIRAGHGIRTRDIQLGNLAVRRKRIRIRTLRPMPGSKSYAAEFRGMLMKAIEVGGKMGGKGRA